MLPTRPLSPTMKSAAALRSPQHRHRHRSSPKSSLQLPALPRFHPANYPSSQASSTAVTPESGINSPQGPISPRQEHRRQYSEAQTQLYLHQRELINFNRNSFIGKSSPSPRSPRLEPLGSPGLPVTPLELEGQVDYMGAGVGRTGSGRSSQVDLTENYIEEGRRTEPASGSRSEKR